MNRRKFNQLLIALPVLGVARNDREVEILVEPRGGRLFCSAANDRWAHGNVAPSILIQGAKTGLKYADGIALDNKGYVHVANSSNVPVFSPSARGDAAPVMVIAGNNTQLPANSAGATGIAVSRNGKIFVAVQNDSTNRTSAAQKPASVRYRNSRSTNKLLRRDFPQITTLS